jgi:hypothetical protein
MLNQGGLLSLGLCYAPLCFFNAIFIIMSYHYKKFLKIRRFHLTKVFTLTKGDFTLTSQGLGHKIFLKKH